MRSAPSYEADRFPADFVASVVAGAVTALTLGPLAWWLLRAYLRQTYPTHPELASAAVLAGVLDGLLLATGAFVACFAIRIWRYERRERKRSDQMLRRELASIGHDDGAGPPQETKDP